MHFSNLQAAPAIKKSLWAGKSLGLFSTIFLKLRLIDVKPEQTGRFFTFEGRKHFFGKIPVNNIHKKFLL